MSAPVFIGDELTAAGYRLAGARIVVPQPGEAARALAGALQSAEFVLISASCADGMPQPQLDLALRRADPPVVVVPDVAGLAEPANLVAEVDRALGIDQ